MAVKETDAGPTSCAGRGICSFKLVDLNRPNIRNMPKSIPLANFNSRKTYCLNVSVLAFIRRANVYQ